MAFKWVRLSISLVAGLHVLQAGFAAAAAAAHQCWPAPMMNTDDDEHR